MSTVVCDALVASWHDAKEPTTLQLRRQHETKRHNRAGARPGFQRRYLHRGRVPDRRRHVGRRHLPALAETRNHPLLLEHIPVPVITVIDGGQGSASAIKRCWAFDHRGSTAHTQRVVRRCNTTTAHTDAGHAVYLVSAKPDQDHHLGSIRYMIRKTSRIRRCLPRLDELDNLHRRPVHQTTNLVMEQPYTTTLATSTIHTQSAPKEGQTQPHDAPEPDALLAPYPPRRPRQVSIAPAVAGFLELPPSECTWSQWSSHR